eukprot:scaffold10670_cov60-Cyclotella_meneghiniana.AAC.2
MPHVTVWNLQARVGIGGMLPRMKRWLEITTTTSTTSSSSLLKIQESQDGCQVQTPLNEEQGPVSMDVEAII